MSMGVAKSAAKIFIALSERALWLPVVVVMALCALIVARSAEQPA